MAKLLIVEDDPVIAKNVQAWLEKENHTVDVVGHGDEGLYLLLNYAYDLAILDWQLPGKQGAEICQLVRDSGNDIPILMLTSRSSLSDRVKGLDCGAYDYIVKPCALSELSARIRALLRRPGDAKTEELVLGNLELNLASHEALVNGTRLSLSPSEYLILALLARTLETPFTAEAILARLWADKPNVSKQLVRVHITHLRQKLAAAGSHLRVVSQKRDGYMAVIDSGTTINDVEDED
jgi:two-component system, OmpR family, response regulator